MANNCAKSSIFSPNEEYILKADVLTAMEHGRDTQPKSRNMPNYFYGDYLTSTPNYAVNINFQLLQNPNFNQSPGHYQQYAQQLQHQQFHQPIPQSPHPGTLTNNVSRRNFITEMADKSYVANQYTRNCTPNPKIRPTQGKPGQPITATPVHFACPKSVLSKCHFDKHSTDVLYQHYHNVSKFISRQTRVELAEKTRLNEQQVKTWFQNRRMKEKRVNNTPPLQEITGRKENVNDLKCNVGRNCGVIRIKEGKGLIRKCDKN